MNMSFGLIRWVVLSLIREHALFNVLACVLVVWILGSQTLSAQQFDVNHLNNANGLSQGFVSELIRDSDGFIWIGTFSGLNRYDGHEVKVFMFNPNDPYAPAGNRATCVFEDSKKRIWVAYPEGIDCYDRKTERFYHLGIGFNLKGLQKAEINDIQEHNGKIWLFSRSYVVEMTVPSAFPFVDTRTKDFKYQVFSFPKKDADNLPDYLYAIHLKNKAAVTLGNESRFVFDEKTRTWNQVTVSFSPQRIEDSTIELVYDPVRKGYWRRNNTILEFVKNGVIEKSIKLNVKYDIFQYFDRLDQIFYCDNEGDLWLLSDYAILFIQPETGITKEVSTGILKRNIYLRKMIPDGFGGIWVGTNGYGLIHISKKKSFFRNMLEGMSVNQIWGVPDNKYGLVSEGKYHENEVGRYDAAFTLSGLVDPWLSMRYAKDGTQYVVSSKQDKHGYFRIKHPNGTQKEFVITEKFDGGGIHQALLIDHNQDVWFVDKLGYLFRYNKDADTLQKYNFKHILKNSLPSFVIKQIYQSRNDIIWLATDQGLIQVTKSQNKAPTFKLWQNVVNNPKSLNNNSIISVLDDPAEPDKYLWVATNGSGINKFNKATGDCLHFTKNNGLPDNVVYGILADSYGRLWMSTNFGLSCFTPSLGSFWNFTTQDGLPDNEFNTYAYHKTSNGKMLFGGLSGLVSFNPDSILADTAFARIFITGIKINNRQIQVRDSTGILALPLEYNDKIKVKYNQNLITISFASLEYAMAKSTKYTYKLLGVDQDWVFGGDRNDVTYANLSSGTYTLYVANFNQKGEINPNPAKLTIVVSPPWWRTWLAYFVYSALIGLLAWIIFNAQIRRIKIQNDLMYKEKETAKYKELDELKTRFFTNITHEFRTTLTLILEPSKQLLKTKQSPILDKQHSIIYNNASRMLALVNQLLDFSKLSSGNVELKVEKTNITLLVQDIISQFQSVVESKQQTISLHSTPSVLMAQTDRQFIEKIVYNLVSNAHKFTMRGGQIMVTLKVIGDQQWLLSIQDNGIGIAKDQHEAIFDRFYQIENGLTRSNEGTGIGLSLVKELVNKLGGTILVKSEPNKGTEFVITMPLLQTGTYVEETLSISEPQQQMEPITVETKKNNGQDSILLVEDNNEMRDYLSIILEENNFTVIQAENGKAGLSKAFEHMPDLIITDVMMPEMDGYELTELLKNDRITDHIPVVMLTAKGRLESKLEGYSKGADAFLPKPFHTEELLIRIKQLLTSRKRLQERFQQTLQMKQADSDVNLSNEEATQKPVSELAWLKSLEQRILIQLGEYEFTVDALLPELFMSRTQFYSKLKATTGLTPAQYIRQLRLDRAYEILKAQPEVKISDVIEMVGLRDLKTFNINFKERFGKTAIEVRDTFK